MKTWLYVEAVKNPLVFLRDFLQELAKDCGVADELDFASEPSQETIRGAFSRLREHSPPIVTQAIEAVLVGDRMAKEQAIEVLRNYFNQD